MPNQTHIIWLGYLYTLKLDLFNVIFIGSFNLVNNIVEKTKGFINRFFTNGYL